MAYTDVGLTPDMITALKSPWRKTGWRVKALKATGTKLPDVTTTNIDKIDAGGGTYPLSTTGGRYKKIVHDQKNNRTFILHNEEADENTNAVVTIINHFLDTNDADYIESVNKNNSAGWDDGYTGVVARDMDYNPDLNQLAVAFDGYSTTKPPALFVLDMDKYIEDLKTNVCNKLDDNPDYLNCTVAASDPTYTGYQGSYIQHVRYYQSRWWVWVVASEGFAPSDPDNWWRSIGYFNGGNLAYNHVWLWGYAPRFSDTNLAGDPWDSSIMFPSAPRNDVINDGGSPATADGWWGDSMAMFWHVESFDIQDGGAAGKIVIGTSARSDNLVDIAEFGVEAFVVRIDIQTMFDEIASPTLIASGFVYANPVFVGPNWELAVGTSSVSTVVGSDPYIEDIRGYVRVVVEQAHTGSKSGVEVDGTIRVQTSYGTMNASGESASGVATQKEWNHVIFCDAETDIKIGTTHGAYDDPVGFTLRWDYEIYEALPGLESCIGVHSDDPIVQTGDSDRPATLPWTDGFGYAWNIARKNASAVYTQIYGGVYYSTANNKFVFPVLAEGGPPDVRDGLGLWVHDETTLWRGTPRFPTLVYNSSNTRYDALCAATTWSGNDYNFGDPTGPTESEYCMYVAPPVGGSNSIWVGTTSALANNEPVDVFANSSDLGIDGTADVDAILTHIDPGPGNIYLTLLCSNTNTATLQTQLAGAGYAVDRTLTSVFVQQGAGNDYVFDITAVTDGNVELWGQDGAGGARNTATDLAHPYVGHIHAIDDEYIILASNDTLKSNLAIQFFQISDNTFLDNQYDAALIYSASGNEGNVFNDCFFDPDTSMIGFSTYYRAGTAGEIWLWAPETITGKWDRDPRVWWDGSESDLLIGAGSDNDVDELDQTPMLLNPQISQSKMRTSYEFRFDVSGFNYLPWIESDFNRNPDFLNKFDGVLQDGTRLIVERGVMVDNNWYWVQEGQFFIIKSPADCGAGIADLDVVAMGPISLLVTRATYEGTHEPDVATYTDAAMTTTDNLTFIHSPGGNDVTDWKLRPEPVVFVDGVEVFGYTIDTAKGTVTFGAAETGTVTATFDAYDPGTNETEDIIYCILTYPNELGGCGLDETYITDNKLGEELTDSGDGKTWTCSKNMIRANDGYNAVYVDSVLKTEGVDYDFDAASGGVPNVHRLGHVIFVADQSGKTVTANYTYYTIQKSGVTLPLLNFHPREQKSSYDAINTVVRYTAPNYIIRERRDGKIEADFYTQKSTGSEDLVIEDSDIIITDLSTNPIYEQMGTRVLSLGQANLEDLPNLCLGKTVTDNWSTHGYAWHAGQDFQAVTDGDPATGVGGGGGGWDDLGFGGITTKALQDVLIATGETGLSLLSVDMGEVFEVATIIIARGSQAAAEGEIGAVQEVSIWASMDDSTWTRLVGRTFIPPGGNEQFRAGTNYDEGTKFRYIRLNIHSVGFYKGPDNDTDSQIGISEIQCYENEIIVGEAKLQNEDSAAELYDQWGLLAKYGLTTHVARGGSPDPGLNTQAKADLDAKYTLEEIVRLLSQVEIRAPWLPAVPVFSTIRVQNGALGMDKTFFIESRSAGSGGDTYSGTTLP